MKPIIDFFSTNHQIRLKPSSCPRMEPILDAGNGGPHTRFWARTNSLLRLVPHGEPNGRQSHLQVRLWRCSMCCCSWVHGLPARINDPWRSSNLMSCFFAWPFSWFESPLSKPWLAAKRLTSFGWDLWAFVLKTQPLLIGSWITWTNARVGAHSPVVLFVYLNHWQPSGIDEDNRPSHYVLNSIALIHSAGECKLYHS